MKNILALANVSRAVRIVLLLSLPVLLTACNSGGDGDGNDGTTGSDKPEDISIVSIASNGDIGNDTSQATSISADGRYVVFESYASNFVDNDTNLLDIFRFDTVNKTIIRVSVADDESQADGSSRSPSVSADGRYVAFLSDATNLVVGDSNNIPDIFVRDIELGTTKRVSVSSSNVETDGGCYLPRISADGRYVVFWSRGTTLVDGDTNLEGDVFVHTLASGVTERVSVASDGAQATGGQSDSPSISGDGRYVAFASSATNLVADDANGAHDVFIHDRTTGETKIVSVDDSGVQAEVGSDSDQPFISYDGTIVVFTSTASNLVSPATNAQYQIFVRDLFAGTTVVASISNSGEISNNYTRWPSISRNKRYVVYESQATNLLDGVSVIAQTNIFLHDLQTGDTVLVNKSTSGEFDNSSSFEPVISADGRYIVFYSEGGNMVSTATNGYEQVYRAPNELY